MKAEIEATKDRPESILSGTGEILDALQDGVRDIRTDVERLSAKPVDMTVSYEILDTLKEGLSSVRAEIDRLRNSGIGEKDIGATESGAVITAENMDHINHLRRNDIENLEVMITQLRIKVEALDKCLQLQLRHPLPQPTI